MATFALEIISRQRRVYRGEVEHLRAPGTLGSLGVLAHHAPLLTPLEKGELIVRRADGVEAVYQVEGGFLEVQNNRAVVLTDKLTEAAR